MFSQPICDQFAHFQHGEGLLLYRRGTQLQKIFTPAYAQAYLNISLYTVIYFLISSYSTDTPLHISLPTILHVSRSYDFVLITKIAVQKKIINYNNYYNDDN